MVAPPAPASEPSSQDVTVPSHAGRTVRVEWTGVIPPGANTSSSCVDALAADHHSIRLTVPAGLYTHLLARAAFAITWSGPTDGIITVVTPDGSAISGDGGFVDADETVKLLNPKAGDYEVQVCAFAGAAPQTYLGSLEVAVAALGVCRSDVAAGVDLQAATIRQLQSALASGRLTSRALVAAYLDRIARYDRSGPKLDAIRELNRSALTQADSLDAERRRSGPRGPLHGIPVLLKDNVGTIDLPTTAGSIALEGSIPLHDSFLAARLRQAGAIILGKTNLSEFANWVDPDMPSGYSSLGGQVINPYHFGDPSGSSSGSGVAAAMAFAAATIGTETSGSILSPSVANSAVGIKPTVGLVSRAGIIPLAATFDTPGPMTRSVADAAIVLGAIAGPDPRDPKTSESADRLPAKRDYTAFLRPDGLRGARIGVSDADRDQLGPEQQGLWDAVLEQLGRLGATVVHSDTLANIRDVGLVELAVIPNEFKHGLNQYLAEETSPSLRVRTLSDIIEFNGRHPDKVKYGQRWLQISDATLGNVDEPTALASRTATIEGSRAAIDSALRADDLDAILAPGAINANVGAAAQYPSIAVPAGYGGGGAQPFGITFLGPAYSEDTLIRLAYAYEQASHRRVRPTAANRGLCPAAPARVGGVRVTQPAPPPATRVLPATGATRDLPIGFALAATAMLTAAWLRRARIGS
jgi:amidase